ncbi:hypothetical protein [Denitromonas sp.]|uniref:hypothetical protein n=1 Tax=Denitromonas sp. TaxID=2734609 RepID=UPI002AFDD905|nr:hypothetical protein [Denitromonas sp.]
MIDVPQRRRAELGLLGGAECAADGDAVLDGKGGAVGGEDGLLLVGRGLAGGGVGRISTRHGVAG